MVNRQVNRRDKERKSGFVYHERDPKKLKERAEQQGGQFDSIFKNGIDTYKPGVGDNQIRILPPTWEDHEHYGLEIWTHGYVGGDRSTYLCPKKMKNKPCPICDAAEESKAAGEKDEADQLKAKKRYLYWIIDRDGDSDMPVVWSVSWSMDRDIAALAHVKKTGKILVIDRPDDGYDIIFKRQGQGLNTRYVGLQIDREASPIDESKKKQREILEHITENPLDSILRFYKADHLAKAMDGKSEEKDEDLDDDDKPKKKKRGRDRDDDEDEDEPKPKRRGRDDDDDDDEEDTPKKKRRSRDDDDDDKPKPKRRSRDEDEDEDDDEDEPKSRRGRSRDDDEDEDDRPKRKRSRDDDEDEEDSPKRKRRARDEDEDPADDDPEDDDDEPKKKKKKRARDDDDEDEDEPRVKSKRRSRDDDEDEDEDERPKKKKKRSRDYDDDEVPF